VQRFQICVVLCLVSLALIPATIRALRGVLVTTEVFTDCIESGGQIKEELDVLPSPTEHASVTVEIRDANDLLHLKYGRGYSVLDATSWGWAHRPYVCFAVGSHLGNAPGNNRKGESLGGMFDFGQVTMEPNCVDCPSGVWTAIVKQRIWKAIWVNCDFGSDDQAPEWEMIVRSGNHQNQVAPLLGFGVRA
jgi:hypothetical protein